MLLGFGHHVHTEDTLNCVRTWQVFMVRIISNAQSSLNFLPCDLRLITRGTFI